MSTLSTTVTSIASNYTDVDFDVPIYDISFLDDDDALEGIIDTDEALRETDTAVEEEPPTPVEPEDPDSFEEVRYLVPDNKPAMFISTVRLSIKFNGFDCELSEEEITDFPELPPSETDSCVKFTETHELIVVNDQRTFDSDRPSLITSRPLKSSLKVGTNKNNRQEHIAAKKADMVKLIAFLEELDGASKAHHGSISKRQQRAEQILRYNARIAAEESDDYSTEMDMWNF